MTEGEHETIEEIGRILEVAAQRECDARGKGPETAIHALLSASGVLAITQNITDEWITAATSLLRGIRAVAEANAAKPPRKH